MHTSNLQLQAVPTVSNIQRINRVQHKMCHCAVSKFHNAEKPAHEQLMTGPFSLLLLHLACINICSSVTAICQYLTPSQKQTCDRN